MYIHISDTQINVTRVSRATPVYMSDTMLIASTPAPANKSTCSHVSVGSHQPTEEYKVFQKKVLHEAL